MEETLHLEWLKDLLAGDSKLEVKFLAPYLHPYSSPPTGVMSLEE